MRCRPGDMVLLLRANSQPCKQFVGHILTVGRLSTRFERAWLFDPPLLLEDGSMVSWNDEDLSPIRDPGDDAVDQTLLWKPVPSEVTAC